MFVNSRVLGYKKFIIITLSNAGRGGDGEGRGGSTKSKPIPAPPRGAGLKYCPILIPPTFAGRGKPAPGEARRDRVKLPSRALRTKLVNFEKY